MQKDFTPKPLPFFYVGQATTTDRVGNYTTQKHPLLSQAIGKPDTKNIWYSKEHLIKLLEEIEHAQGDGFRVHFGMYEAGHEYEGQLCLQMNVTRAVSVEQNTYHVNVILEEEADYPERSSLQRDVIGDDNAGKRDFNYGSPCPPLCDPPPYDKL
jgi:hypothetical protein